jgi:hypothetical protein
MRAGQTGKAWALLQGREMAGAPYLSYERLPHYPTTKILSREGDLPGVVRVRMKRVQPCILVRAKHARSAPAFPDEPPAAIPS